MYTMYTMSNLQKLKGKKKLNKKQWIWTGSTLTLEILRKAPHYHKLFTFGKKLKLQNRGIFEILVIFWFWRLFVLFLWWSRPFVCGGRAFHPKSIKFYRPKSQKFQKPEFPQEISVHAGTMAALRSVLAYQPDSESDSEPENARPETRTGHRSGFSQPGFWF